MASLPASRAERAFRAMGERAFRAMGERAFRATAFAFAAMLGAAPVTIAADVPPAGDLSLLLRGMRSAVGVVAEFKETKHLALLSSPLEATGTIYFVPPRRLVREVTSPGRSRLVVDGDRVRMEDDNGSRKFDLSASPVARQLVDSFVVLFNGDEERLKELYEATFRSEGATWHLHLKPRSMPLTRMVASFEMAGSGARIDRMESVEPDGDRTVTTFGITDVEHRFDDDELSRLFSERAQGRALSEPAQGRALSEPAQGRALSERADGRALAEPADGRALAEPPAP